MEMTGKKVAHYEILARIGAGGMGEVYRARDLKLHRDVAIKFLPSEKESSPDTRERLKSEARTLAALNHPNIVTIYSVEEESGTHFVTMELLEGDTLNTIIAGRGLSQARFVEFALQLFDAMRSAHSQGIVHRDLKPSNIMVTRDQRLKVLDFGIAKVLPGGEADKWSSEPNDFSTRLVTQPGLVLGTVSHFSPEQAQGQLVDRRSDIFSLGIILYQMATGRHPFPGENAAMIVSSILRDAPRPIDDFEAPWLRRLFPILQRCLQKSPDQRYQQVSELFDDLIAFQKEASAAVGTKSSDELIQSRGDTPARGSWTTTLQGVPPADAWGELSPDELERLSEAAWWKGQMDDCCHLLERAYAGYLSEKHPHRAALMALKMADIFHHRASRSVSGGWLKRAQRLLENAKDSVEYGYLLRFQTVIAIEVDGDANTALELAKQSFEIANRTADKNLLALSTQDQGRVLVDQGQLTEGMALLDEAMATALSGELTPMTVARTYCNMISACERTADYRRASEWTEEARHWCEPLGGSPFPGICSVHRAEIMRLRGALNEAEREVRQVCADPRGYVDTAAAAYYEMGEIRRRRGDYEGAEEAFRQAHERGRNPVPGLPLLLLAQGKTDAAASLITRAIAGSVLPLDRARLLPSHIRIALAASNLEGASTSIEELESIATHFGSAALKAAAAQARGNLELVKEEFEKAASSLRRALELWLEVDLPYEAAMTRLLLGQAYNGMGDTASADLELRAARSAFEKLGAQAALHEFDTMMSSG